MVSGNKHEGSRFLTNAGLVLALLLAVVLSVAPLLSGCSAVPTNEPVQIVIKVPRTSHSSLNDESISTIDEVVTLMAEDFMESYSQPVDVKVEVFEQSAYEDAVAGSFDTDKAADVFYGDYFNMSTFIHSGHVVPLDDIITPELQQDIYPFLWELSTVEDGVYMMPYLARQNVLAYNKDLFRQAGLESYIQDDGIQSWTQEEWTIILDTLAANLPQNTFPLMMYAHSSQGDTHIMTMLRAYGSPFFDEHGHFALSDLEAVQALDWIQQGVDRGWYPPHAENLEIEDCSRLFRGGQLAIYMINNVSVGRYGDSIGLVNFPGPDGGNATMFVSGFEVFDNGDPEKLQVAKDFLAHVYGSEPLMEYAAGTIPASMTVAEKYADETPRFTDFQENQTNVVDFTGGNPDTLSVREVFHEGMAKLLRKELTPEETAAWIDERANNAIDAGWATHVIHS